jgi:hypothetical protein
MTPGNRYTFAFFGSLFSPVSWGIPEEPLQPRWALTTGVRFLTVLYVRRAGSLLYSLPMLRVAASFLALLLLVLTGCHGFFSSPVLQTISISPASVATGSSVQLVATGTYDDGSTNTISSGITWAATNGTGTVTITSGGVVTGVTAGTATITATVGSVQGEESFTVGTLQSIAITPNPAVISFSLGTTTQQLTATGTFSGGQSVNISQSVTWTITGSTTLSIATSGTNAGTVTATGQGSAVVTAAESGVSTTDTVTAQ